MVKPVCSNRWLVLLCGAVAMAPLRAQEAAVDETPPLPEYRVELIVFEYLDSKGADEDWTADPLRELTAPALVVDSDTSVEGIIDETDETVAAPAVEVEFRYRPVSDDVLSFGEYVDQMRRSRDFRPLIHTAWEQPGYPRDVASPLDLARIVRLPERLNGTVTLWLGRFLHLDVALDLMPQPGASTSQPFTAGPPPSYKMRESRLLRSRRLHFLDHPKFGLLVRIDPVDTPPSADNEFSSGE